MFDAPVVHPPEALQSLPLDWRQWKRMMKKPNPVLMYQMPTQFEVETAEGRMGAQEGDWLVHDPLSGHYWPISDEYKQMHYEEAS